MEDEFKIYIDQLRHGQERLIEEKLESSFLDIHEDDLEFPNDVLVEGKAYLAEDELIIHWTITTEALVSCLICNQKVPVEVRVANNYQSIALSDIKGGIFSFKELLREVILLEVPAYVECEGRCPRRKEYSKYLQKPSTEQSQKEEGYRPFADLDWK
jgi:uncharacterized metal-binding protein YceD (DUF177 family)